MVLAKELGPECVMEWPVPDQVKNLKPSRVFVQGVQVSFNVLLYSLSHALDKTKSHLSSFRDRTLNLPSSRSIYSHEAFDYAYPGNLESARVAYQPNNCYRTAEFLQLSGRASEYTVLKCKVQFNLEKYKIKK